MWSKEVTFSVKFLKIFDNNFRENWLTFSHSEWHLLVFLSLFFMFATILINKRLHIATTRWKKCEENNSNVSGEKAEAAVATARMKWHPRKMTSAVHDMMHRALIYVSNNNGTWKIIIITATTANDYLCTFFRSISGLAQWWSSSDFTIHIWSFWDDAEKWIFFRVYFEDDFFYSDMTVWLYCWLLQFIIFFIIVVGLSSTTLKATSVARGIEIFPPLLFHIFCDCDIHAV
jgi:hypothetical protein